MSRSVSQTLWYEQPATQWEEALPVGNGRLGAMVFGGLEAERLQLNHDSLWSGGPEDADNPAALPALGRIRELLFARQFAAAQELADRTQICQPSTCGSFGCYQTLGDLCVRFDGHASARGYRRELDLGEAVVRVCYRLGDTAFRRETFASAPDQVLVMELSSDQPGRVSCVITLSRPECATVDRAAADGLVLRGRLRDRGQPTGMRFLALLRVVSRGGKLGHENGTLRVTGADSATLLLTAATDYRGQPYAAVTARRIHAAAEIPYADLRARHVRDHRSLFSRVTVDLGQTETSELPTDRRLVAFASGADDSALSALYLQFGRYLLISSSRPGTMAANLQGIWADGVQTPWNCDYHTNINLQMNYWLAEPANLAECAEPLVGLVDAMRNPGARTARIHYGARGWVVHTIHNVWGFTAPGQNPMWGLSPLAGVWLCQHLWEHYAFGGDRSYLARVHPILRSAAEFCLDWLVEDPRSGRLVSGPATSPENTFLTDAGEPCSISMGPSMDQEIVWDHFTNLLEAAATLGSDDDLVRQVRSARERLAWPGIGSDGRLLEWAEEFREAEPEHRHVSHLFALYPGRQISPRTTPELGRAACQSLLGRGDGGTGWSMAWKICFWARLGDGDLALRLLKNLLCPAQHQPSGAGVYPNLFCAHPPFQIDGNLGGAAGIVEMLLQSHDGSIALLPALPRDWATGSVTGLCARDGFEVDLAWRDGELTEATLLASLSRRATIRYREKTLELSAEAGRSYDIGRLLG
jgi:alpha-L-fucosidase 2